LTESILAKAGKLRMVVHATGRYFVSKLALQVGWRSEQLIIPDFVFLREKIKRLPNKPDTIELVLV
ncbi:hypothetical protein FRC00_005589, partial [Tulasnella sp. 408]